MDPLHLAIALGPAGIYLMLIGLINLTGRPFLTTGLRDFMTLAIGVSGFAIAGPLDLFMPEAAVTFLGHWIWLPLVMLYYLIAILLAMVQRPRLVLYNLTVDQLRPILEEEASTLDPQRRWAGNSLALPQLGVQLNVEYTAGMKTTQLVATGGNQDLAGWRRLEVALRRRLQQQTVSANPRGFSFLLIGILMWAVLLYGVISQPQEVAQALHRLLRH